MDWSSIAGASVAALLTFVWSKLRGEKTASWDDTIRGVGKQLVHELVVFGDMRAQAMQDAAATFMAQKLRGLGIPSNAITDALIRATVEHAIGDALAELRKLANDADANIQRLNEIAARTDQSFDKARAEGLARVKDMQDMIEVEPAKEQAP